MAVIPGCCPRCSSPIDIRVGQSLQRDRIEWFKSHRCPHCGLSMEEDGDDPTPEEIREAILLEEGEWTIAIESTDEEMVKVMKVLRESLRLTLAETAELRRRLPDELIHGTKTEMSRLAHAFQTAGLTCRIVSR